MTRKVKETTDKLTITQTSYIDLNNLVVSRPVEGKKRPVQSPMTVREFIEYVSSHGLDGTVSCGYDYYDSGYSEATQLIITTQREETDEEYSARMKLLADIASAKRDAAKKKKAQQDEAEVALLRKLMKKHKGKLNEI